MVGQLICILVNKGSIPFVSKMTYKAVYTYCKINGQYFNVEKGRTILEVCASKEIDIEIPRFCYHELLSIAGNCRMCLVEVNTSAKLLPLVL